MNNVASRRGSAIKIQLHPNVGAIGQTERSRGGECPRRADTRIEGG